MKENLEQIKTIDWTLIAHFKRTSRRVNVQFKVLKKSQPRTVTERGSGRRHLISDCIVGDNSAIVNLTLWNEDIDVVELNRTYELLNGYINLFDECMTLTKSRKGELTESIISIDLVNDQIDMSRPFMGKPKQRKKPRSATGRSFRGTAGREAKGYCSRKSF